MPTLSTRILQGLLLSVVGGLLGRFLMLILENAGLSDAAMPVAFAIFIASLVYYVGAYIQPHLSAALRRVNRQAFARTGSFQSGRMK